MRTSYRFSSVVVLGVIVLSALSEAPAQDIKATAPIDGIIVHNLDEATDLKYREPILERLPLVERTFFLLDIENQTGQDLTFEEAEFFFLDEDGALLGTTTVGVPEYLEATSVGRRVVNFSSSSSEWLEDVAVDASGRFVAAGPAFDKDTGLGGIGLVRFHPDTFPDDSFSGDGYHYAEPAVVPEVAIRAIAVDSVGRIVVGGTGHDPNLSFYARRFLENSSLDVAFGVSSEVTTDLDGHAEAWDLAIDDEDRVVLVGSYQAPGSQHVLAVARYDVDGTPDATLGGDGFATADLAFPVVEVARAVAVDSQGRIVVGGSGIVFGHNRFIVARFLENGSLDPTFGSDGHTLTNLPGSTSEVIFDIAISQSGRIVCGGLAVVDGEQRFVAARYDTDGTLDTNFSGDGWNIPALPPVHEAVRGIALDPLSRTIAAGYGLGDESNEFAVARFTGVGGLDPSFHPSGVAGALTTSFPDLEGADAFAVATLADDHIAVVGRVQTEDGVYQNAVAVYEPNGAPLQDASFPDGERVKIPLPGEIFPRKLAPSNMNVRVHFEEFETPLIVTGFKFRRFEQNDFPLVFPVPPQNDGPWHVNQGHDKGNNHTGSGFGSQRFAYDIGFRRAYLDDGEVKYSSYVEDCDTEALKLKYDALEICDFEVDLDLDYPAADFAECSAVYDRPVRAIADGIVIFSFDGFPNGFPVSERRGNKEGVALTNGGVVNGGTGIPGGGNYAMIDHGHDNAVLYAHMRPGSVLVEAGDTVDQGQVIGRIGSTGRSSGSHLHFHAVEWWSYTEPCSGGTCTFESDYGPALPMYFTDLQFQTTDGGPLRTQLRSSMFGGTLFTIEEKPEPPLVGAIAPLGPGAFVVLNPGHDLLAATRVQPPVEISSVASLDDPAHFADGGDDIEAIYRFVLNKQSIVRLRLDFDDPADMDMILYRSDLWAIRPEKTTRLKNPESLVVELDAGVYYVFVSLFDEQRDSDIRQESYTLEIEIDPAPGIDFKSPDVGPPCEPPKTVVLDVATDEPIGGFSLAMTWNPQEFEILELRPGPAIPPDAIFLEADVDPEDLAEGNLLYFLALEPGTTLGPGAGIGILELIVRAGPASSVGETGLLCFDSTLGSPPQETVFSVLRNDEFVSVASSFPCRTIDFTDDGTPPTIGAVDVLADATAGEDGVDISFDVVAEDDCGDVTVECDRLPGSRFPVGVTTVTCLATDSAGNQSEVEFEVTVREGDGGPLFLRGDSNVDGTVNVSDALNALNRLFLGSGTNDCPDASDFNDDGQFNVADPVAMLGYLILGEAGPPAPGAQTCGEDPTDDSLEPCVVGEICGGS